MKTLLLSSFIALAVIIAKSERAPAQGDLFPSTAEGCAAIVDPTLQTDCQVAYQFRQFYQGRIADLRTIYQLAELRQSATVWIAPDYGNTLTFDPPARVIVLQQFTLNATEEPWIHVRFASGNYGFIQTRVVE